MAIGLRCHVHAVDMNKTFIIPLAKLLPLATYNVVVTIAYLIGEHFKPNPSTVDKC